MSSAEINENNPVITGLPAHYCGPWEYERFTRELFAREGYDMLNPDLPIEDPDITYDEFAAMVRAAQRERGAREYVDLAHSWGGDLTYRQIDDAPVSMHILLGTPLRHVLENKGIPEDPESRGIFYHAIVKAEEKGDLPFDREYTGAALFRGIGDLALRRWATDQLIPHPHKPKEHGRVDVSAYIPDDLITYYVGFEHDNIFNFASQIRTAKNLNIEFESISTRHFPMLEDPRLLVRTVVKAIELKKEEREQRLNSYYAAAGSA